MNGLSEADTKAKLIDPAIHKRGWTEDLIRREETAGSVEIIAGKARRRYRDAAIRAVLEKIVRCQLNGQPKRALLSMATGCGKTFVAAGLLKRVGAMLNRQMVTVERARKAAGEELEAINALPGVLLRRAFAGES